MEFFLFTVVLGLVVTALVQRAEAAKRDARIVRLEGELDEAQGQLGWVLREAGYAKGAFEGLAARVAPLERALAEARQPRAPALPAPVDATAAGPEPTAAKPALAAAVAPDATPLAIPDAASPPPAPPAADDLAESPTAPGADGTVDPAPAPPADAPAADPSAPVPVHPSAPVPVHPSAPVPAGRPRPAAPRPASAPPPPPSIAIDWERWLGVRGAAAAGAAILVLASLYFFKYSIDAGFFGPSARVVTGTGVGLACLLGSLRARDRDHVVLADWIAGAGISILYTAFWAAHSLYDLIPGPIAFALMIAVTAACVALSVRHSSQVVAVLGLLGGFVTPFALSSGEDHPVGLFGYLLLLDGALIGVGRRKAWRVVTALCVAGTLLYQLAWIGGRMGPDDLGLGMSIVVVFAALFAVTARPADAPAGEGVFVEGGSVLAPFVFGLYFGLRADLAPHVAPVALMVAIVSAAACVLAEIRGARAYPLVAAVGSLAVLLGWTAAHDPPDGAIELLGCTLLVAGVFHGYLEVRRRRGHDEEGFPPAALAGAVAAIGAMVVIFVAAVLWIAPIAPPAVLAGWVVLAGLALRQAGLPGRARLHLAVAIAIGVLLPALHAAQADAPFYAQGGAALAVALAAAGALLGVALVRRDEDARRTGLHAAALIALLLLVEPLAFPHAVGPGALLAVATLLGGIALFAAAVLCSGPWVLAATLTVAFVDTAWALGATAAARPDVTGFASLDAASLAAEPGLRIGLAALGLSAALFTAWPVALSRRFEGAPWAFRASALAGPAFLVPVRAVWIALFGDAAIGLVPAGLAVLAFGAGMIAHRRLDADAGARPDAPVWLFGATIALVSVAIPMQLRDEGITIGYGALGVALVGLWSRFDHPGMKLAGLAHLALATARLTLNPFVLEYHPRTASLLFNWLLPTYGLPALALIAAAYVLGPREVARLRPWELRFYGSARPLGALGSGFAAVLVVFAWVNLTILNAYSPAGALAWSFHHEPARDLTLSVAWAVYALGLLALGTTRKSAALRWTSLVLILTTALKVFLYDLGHLRDLYRVASLVGLAFSLILISLAYQRFVFGAKEGAKKDDQG